MNDAFDPDLPDGALPDMTAGELALGLLDGDERAAAMRRVLAEPAFAREVGRWRGQLAQLFDLWPPMAAPDLLTRIERSIDRPRDAFAPEAAVALPPATRRPPSRLWPAFAALSSIAAAGLLVALLVRPLPVPTLPPPPPVQNIPAPTLVASLDPGHGGSPVTAFYDARGGTIRLTEAKLADAGQSAELWVIPADGTPHALGLLRAEGGTALPLDPVNRARIAAHATLAVSIEPEGGSKTGLPTGPVVAKGTLSEV